MRVCCLKECFNKNTSENISFYQVKPAWSEFVTKYAKPGYVIRPNTYICSAHFDANLVMKNKHLHRNAMPTIPPTPPTTPPAPEIDEPEELSLNVAGPRRVYDGPGIHYPVKIAIHKLGCMKHYALFRKNAKVQLVRYCLLLS